MTYAFMAGQGKKWPRTAYVRSQGEDSAMEPTGFSLRLSMRPKASLRNGFGLRRTPRRRKANRLRTIPQSPSEEKEQFRINSNTDYCSIETMTEGSNREQDREFPTLDQLVEAVNCWCREQRIRPLRGQASSELTVRTVRFYRVKGLVDAPSTGKGGYRRKHFLQLCAIRILQAQGQPLDRIQELLYGRGEEDLEEILRRGAEVLPPETAPLPLRGHLLTAYTLDEGCALLSRTPLQITDEARRAILEILAKARGRALPDDGSEKAGRDKPTDPDGSSLPEQKERQP